MNSICGRNGIAVANDLLMLGLPVMTLSTFRRLLLTGFAGKVVAFCLDQCLSDLR
jgi:hypothetical protein